MYRVRCLALLFFLVLHEAAKLMRSVSVVAAAAGCTGVADAAHFDVTRHELQIRGGRLSNYKLKYIFIISLQQCDEIHSATVPYRTSIPRSYVYYGTY